MSNFNMFPETYQLFENLGRTAEENVYKDPNTAVFKIRQLAEKIVDAIYSLEGLQANYGETQVDKLNHLRREGVLDRQIEEFFQTIRKTGNQAVHEANVSTDTALNILRLGYYLSSWFLEVYIDYQYEVEDFQVPVDQDKETDKRIAELEAQLEAQEALMQEQMSLNFQNEANQSAQEKQKRRKRSKNFTDRRPPNEAETRVLIDAQLREAGWEADTVELNYKSKKVMPEKGRQMAIAEWPCGKGYADYALFDGLELLGIIEAKPYGKDIAGDLQQSKNYARQIDVTDGMNLLELDSEYNVPFVYSTNGRPYLEQLKEKSGIWFWDARQETLPAYPLEGWHSPRDLRKKLEVDVDQANQELEADNDYPDFISSRYYQVEAVQAVEEALANDQRYMLLAMATGTGKTRVALAIMYRLIKTKRVQRILFLVDRTYLGTQAADALKDTKIDNIALSDIYDVKEVTDQFPEDTTKIHIATVQGMVQRLFNQEDPSKVPSVGTYDFIIVDEAHRGYNEDRELSEDELEYYDEKDFISQYRRVIDYFDAPVLALTATPALHTTNIFGLPIYSYSYTDAVVDGYLVDHNPPYKFETELNQAGITIEKDQQISLWDPDKLAVDKALMEDEMHFDVSTFNKRIINESFNKVIAQALADHIDPTEAGKTLVFAVTDLHADMLVRLLKEAYQERGYELPDEAILKITGANPDAHSDTKRFKNEKYPSMVVTVDLLTTGVDIPEIVNLVFVRKVRSRILYEQMLGRATRLCPEINKEAFNIYDAVQLYDSLYEVTDMKPVAKNYQYTIEEIFGHAVVAEDSAAYEFHRKELVASLQRRKQRLDDEDLEEIREIINQYSIDKWLQDLNQKSQEELEGEQEAIKLMATYQPASKGLIISDEEDHLVGVERGFGQGNIKPADYLRSFDSFIHENINKIPALNIAANRPSDLTREDLRKIELILKKHLFDEKSLQEAWRKDKDEVVIANIISFIRQAALGDPLVDNRSRIQEAMNSVYTMHDWTPIQIKWLKRIEKQLIQSPVLGPDAQSAFDDNGVFSDHGGYKQVKRVFGDQTEEVIDTINENLYG